MKFTARIKKLENLVGIGQRCAHCRLNLRETPDSEADKPPNSYLMQRCEECGSEYRMTLDGCSEREREAYIMLSSYPEDAYYTDEKAHALELWLASKSEQNEQRKNLKGVQTPNHLKKRIPQNKATKLYNTLKEESEKLGFHKHNKKLQKYGDRFSEQDDLITDLLWENREDKELKAAQASSKLETIIWGAPLPETLAEIEKYEKEKLEKEEAKLRENEERKRRDNEFLEHNRRLVAESRWRKENEDNQSFVIPEPLDYSEFLSIK